VVEENEIGVAGRGDAGDLLHFACADEGRGVWTGSSLYDLSGNARARARNQFAKLGERLLRIESGSIRRGLRWEGPARWAFDEQRPNVGADTLSVVER
jgi:hypothetical protein